jgi:uncharacterized membrane protein YoaK (UPF0700 family)
MPSNAVISFTALFAVIGMSIQNTYMRKLLNQYAPNTVMTGNLTQFSIDLFDLLVYFVLKDQWPNKDSIKPALDSFKKVATVLWGFLLGCFFGALLVRRLAYCVVYCLPSFYCGYGPT